MVRTQFQRSVYLSVDGLYVGAQLKSTVYLSVDCLCVGVQLKSTVYLSVDGLYVGAQLKSTVYLCWSLRVMIDLEGPLSYTVLIARHILLRKLSLSTRARTQKSCTVSQLVCAFPNPV